QKQNGGASSAKNLGIKSAKGDFILFLDSDDTINPNTIEDFQFLCESDKLISFGFDIANHKNQTSSNYFLRYPKIEGYFSNIEILKMMYIEKKLWLSTISVLYNRNFIIDNDIFFNEEYSSGEDQSFLVNSLILCDKVLILPKTYSVYHIDFE